jgi:RHS repeat-associated protein
VWTGDRTRRWRTISGDGVVRRAAGLTTLFPKAQQPDGPATAVDLRYPWAGTVSVDGSLLMLESFTQGGGGLPFSKVRLRRLGWDGKVTTMVNVADVEHCTQAGYDPGWAPAGDGGFASEACLAAGSDVGVGPDGSVYIHDYKRIRRIDPSGVITTVADPSVWEWGQPHCDGPGAALCYANGAHPLAVDAEGTVYWVNGTYNQRVMRMGAGGLRQDEQVRVPSPDGALVYAFDRDGVHRRTELARTGALVRDFGYEGAELATMTDGFGNEVSLQRSGGQLAGITNAHGHATQLDVTSSGMLGAATNPASETDSSTYDATLMRTVTSSNSSFTADYWPDGSLRRVTDPVGSYLELVSKREGDEVSVKMRTRLQRSVQVTERRVAGGKTVSAVRGMDGLTVTSTVSEDGVTVTEHPNGMVVTERVAADPQLGEHVQYVSEVVMETPVQGTTKRLGVKRVVDLDGPPAAGGTPGMHPHAVTEWTTVNGRSSVSTVNLHTGQVQVTSAQGRTGSALMDTYGQVWSHSIPNVLPTAYAYDRGRLVSASQGSRSISFEYDAYGNVSKVFDTDKPHRVFVLYDNDEVGRPHHIALSGLMTPSNTIALDFEGAKLTSLTPPAGLAYEMTYVNGYLPHELVEPQPDATPVAPFVTEREYDDDNQLTQLRLPSGQLLRYRYEEATGRLRQVEAADRTITYAYEASTGMLASVSSDDGTGLSYEYDGDLLVSESLSATESGQVSWEYDSDFAVATETVDGQTISYVYDADKLATSVGELAIGHDPDNGRLTSTMLSGRLEDGYGYDAYGDVNEYEARYSDGTGWSSLLKVERTQLDELGRVRRESETIGGERKTLAYRYHLRGWLAGVDEVTTDAQGNEVVTEVAAYTYDGNGNRLNAAASYDGQDRLREDEGYVYGYDRDGSLLQKTAKAGGAVTSYEHDALGRLRAVTLPDGTVVSYQLDPMGRRVAKYKGGELQWTALYRGEHQLVQLRQKVAGGQDVVTRFVYGLGRHVPDYMVRGAETYRLVTDLRGSVRQVVEVGAGTVLQRMAYDAWGEVLQDTAEGAQPFGYAGGQYDADTGLVHFGSRDYDARTGRWTSKDPLGFGSGTTNVYGYANGDPVNLVDPGGRVAIAPLVLLGMAGSAPMLVAHSNDWSGHALMGLSGLAAGDLGALGAGVLRVGGPMVGDLAGAGLRCAMRGACGFTERSLGIRLGARGEEGADSVLLRERPSSRLHSRRRVASSI